MAGRLPVAKGREVVRALGKAGLVTGWIAGSHYLLTFPADPTRSVTVPVPPGRDLKPGTLRAVIRQAGLSVEEFTELL